MITEERKRQEVGVKDRHGVIKTEMPNGCRDG